MTQQPVKNMYKSLFWGAFLTYLIAILLDAKSFQLWPQVQILHENGLQILSNCLIAFENISCLNQIKNIPKNLTQREMF